MSLQEFELLCNLFEEYSKNSIFQLNEYADVSKIHTKIKKMVDEKREEEMDRIEIIYLINMLQVTSVRYKTPIQNWKRILEVYEKLIEVLKEMQEKEKEEKEKEEKEKKEEESDNLDVKKVE